MASNPSPDPGSASSATPDLAPEDRAVLERVAERVVSLRMEVPAILALETGKPLSVLAGQTLHFFEPVIAAMLRLPDYRRFAGLVERREAIEALIRLIEARAEAAAATRRSTGRAGPGRRA